MTAMYCPNCGTKLTEGAMFCSSCGKKIEFRNATEVTNENVSSETLHTAEDTKENTIGDNFAEHKADNPSSQVSGNPNSNKKLTNVIIVCIVAAALVISGIFINNIRIKEVYQANLNHAVAEMNTGGYNAQEAINLVYKVWYNSIYQEHDDETDPYTLDSNGEFYSDFNVAIKNLYDDEDFAAKIEGLKNNKTAVLDYMKKLKNPPEEYEEAYEELQTTYDLYKAYLNSAITPTGTIDLYYIGVNEANHSLSDAIENMKMYLED